MIHERPGALPVRLCLQLEDHEARVIRATFPSLFLSTGTHRTTTTAEHGSNG